jgi:hypothetical protein
MKQFGVRRLVGRLARRDLFHQVCENGGFPKHRGGKPPREKR